MTISQLRYICEVYHCGYISRAAENLHISQPSITIAIQGLEKEFGISLFYRRKKTIIPDRRRRSILYKSGKITRTG